MEIIWHGKTGFTLKNDEATIVIDPYKDFSGLSGDFVLTALEENERSEVAGATKVFDWPGEYEMKGIPIVAMLAHEGEKTEDNSPKETLVYFFDIDGIRVCHLGNLGHPLTSEMVKSMGDVDVLIINGDNESPLGIKKSEELIEAVEPRSIAFMGTQNPTALLKALGGEDVEPVKKVILKNKAALPDDKRAYFLFEKV